MKIDYLRNPLAIINRFVIPYGDPSENLQLEGRIIGHIEEGFNHVTWFDGKVVYPKHKCEVGGQQFSREYEELKRGDSNLRVVALKLKEWCKSMNLKIARKRYE